MKVTGVKTYVVENEPGERAGGGDTSIKWYIGGKYFLILDSEEEIYSTSKEEQDDF